MRRHVALETEIIVVVVPAATQVEPADIRFVNFGISPFHAVTIGVTARPGAGRIRSVVTDRAVLNIGDRRQPMPVAPVGGRMLQRHPPLTQMAVVTE